MLMSIVSCHYKGQVDVTVKQTLESLSIRMPGWIGLSDVKVIVDGKEKQLTFDGPLCPVWKSHKRAENNLLIPN